MEKFRILVIEDDPAIGQSLIDGFHNQGYESHLSTTGLAGIEFATSITHT